MGLRPLPDDHAGTGAAQVIDKGIPTAGLLLVLVAKYSDLLLYRQEQIFGRAGMTIAARAFAQWVGVCPAQPLFFKTGKVAVRHP